MCSRQCSYWFPGAKVISTQCWWNIHYCIRPDEYKNITSIVNNMTKWNYIMNKKTHKTLIHCRRHSTYSTRVMSSLCCHNLQHNNSVANLTQIAKFMGPTWGLTVPFHEQTVWVSGTFNSPNISIARTFSFWVWLEAWHIRRPYLRSSLDT